MMRSVGAVLIGLIAGMAVNMAIILLNMYVLFPMPPGLDMNDGPAMSAYVATLPLTALLIVIVAHLGQSFVGGWVAARLSASAPVRQALIVGVLSLLAGVLNMMQIAAPTWMMIELPLYLVVAYAAGQLVARSRDQA